MPFKTAATLTFLVYMLSQHPEVMRRLREEVLSTVGPSRRPTLDDMREMKYMKAVINGNFAPFIKCGKYAHTMIAETLRLYPPV